MGSTATAAHRSARQKSTLVPNRARCTAKQSCFLQCCRCQQRIPACLPKGLFTQPAGDAVTPGFPLAVRRVIV